MLYTLIELGNRHSLLRCFATAFIVTKHLSHLLPLPPWSICESSDYASTLVFASSAVESAAAFVAAFAVVSIFVVRPVVALSAVVSSSAAAPTAIASSVASTVFSFVPSYVAASADVANVECGHLSCVQKGEA